MTKCLPQADYMKLTVFHFVKRLLLTYLPLIKIHAEKSLPEDAFAAIKYRDYWYWIDDCDYRSKGIFTFLMIIMTLADTGEPLPVPIVTIQGN